MRRRISGSAPALGDLSITDPVRDAGAQLERSAITRCLTQPAKPELERAPFIV